MNQIPEGRRGADDPAGGGVPRHRVDAGAPGYPEATYSDAAQYLDNAWRQSSGQGPAVNPHEIPTQVVPVQSAPVQSAPGQSAAGQSAPGESAPVPPAAAQPSPGPAGAGTVAQPFPPVDPRSAPSAHPAAPGVPGPRGAADANPVDLGAYAMSPAAAAGGGGAPSEPGAFPAAPEADRPRGRRKMIAVWSVVSAVALVGAGLVAVKSMKSDKDHNSASSASPTATIPVAPPSAPATSAGPTSAPPSTSPTATASGTGKSTKSPTATSTSKKAKTGTDDDGDGITDDPGATDPNQLSAGARTAYQQAKTAMAANGITLTLTSGKRSFQHQQDLWDQEVRDTGSTAAARNRVLPPAESSHVQGIAIDINIAAQAWMKSKGSQYGWCQIYANEAWHFEYRASYKTSGCPTLKPHP